MPEPAGGLVSLGGRPGAPPGVAGATGTPLPAPPASGTTVTITLDGRQVSAPEGEVLIAAAERAGTYIPRFCYHPRMKPVGMCRMCLVEVKGPRGYSLSPACYLPVVDGMEVVTKSEPVKKAQDGILEFLLINHPLDCPVCDKGGECPLQDQTLAYGPGETRFVEEKRHWDKPVPISPLILIDRERCIQCARCTRFAEEVAGDPAIDFFSRSDSTEVAPAPGLPFTSNFSGNIVQICPVGALLAKPYRFKARPWDLEQVESTCTYCAVGCRVAAQSSADQVVRFIGVDSDPVNWGWLCDKGRFGFEALNSPERLAQPLVRRVAPGNGTSGTGELVEASWTEAMALVTERLKGLDGSRVGVIGGARLPNEDAYLWAKFARTVLRTGNLDAQLGDGLAADLLASLPRATIDQVCQAPLIVTLAPDLKEELPVLYLRLRHAVVETGAPLIEISPAPTGLSSRAALRLHYRPGELLALVQTICSTNQIKGGVAGVPAQDLIRAQVAVHEAAGKVGTAGTGNGGPPSIAVVLGRPSLAEPSTKVEEAARWLGQLPGSAFLPALRRSNVHGAIDLGLAPGLLPGRVGLEDGRGWYEQQWGVPLPAGRQLGGLEILEAAAAGRMDVLFLLGADPLADCPDQGLAARALDRAGYVVALDTFATASVTRAADVVLPVAMYTERRGSFTNLEGRVSWLAQKVTPPGTARPDWMVAAELASRLGVNMGLASLDDIWAEIERVSPLHQGLSQALLVSRQSRNGVVVPLGLETAEPEHAVVPPPLDPMADPGIASAETHPAPPVELSVAGMGVGRTNAPGAGAEDLQAQGGAAAAGPGAPGERLGGTKPPAPKEPGGFPPMLHLGPPRTDAPPTGKARSKPPGGSGSSGEPGGSGSSEEPAGPPLALKLVATRPMWDGGTLVQRSPSLGGLHPALELRANPEDLRRLAIPSGAQVRASSPRGSALLPAVADPRVPLGVAVLPFNLPGGGAGQLIDGASETTEVRIEAVEVAP
jgi:NADH-quinone oxidoreductase subunit G